MSDKLVDDLRQAADSWTENLNYGRSPPYMSKEDSLLWRAADRIEYLRNLVDCAHYRMDAPDPDDHSTWTVKDGPWPYSKMVERGGWRFYTVKLPHD